jgi:cell division protein FtsN
MDLAVYINELLGLKGEVNVPGIGFFRQKRINGYYSEHEKKFYPPRHEIIFDPQPKEDEGLAAYISNKKNISPASAKYFIEKYATGLKTQAAEQKVDITGLGYLFYEYSMLAFKAGKAYETNDPSFYGFAPVKANKAITKAPTVETPSAKSGPVPEKVKTEPAAVEPAAESVPAEEEKVHVDTRSYIPQEGYEDEVVESPRRNRTWVIMLLILIIALLCFGVFYQYKPEWFGRNRPADTTIIINKRAPVRDSDSVKTNAKDTIPPVVAPASTVKAPVDTYNVVRYEIQAGAFRTQTKLKAVMAAYEKLGLRPRILQHAPGTLQKITLGTYFDRNEGIRVEDSIKNIQGIIKNDISLQQYNPIKK